jgi:hypothetical protein
MSNKTIRQYEQHRIDAGLDPLRGTPEPEFDQPIPFTLADAHRVADDEPPKGFREPWGAPQPRQHAPSPDYASEPMTQGEQLAAVNARLTVALADLGTCRLQLQLALVHNTELATNLGIALDTIQAFRQLLAAHK